MARLQADPIRIDELIETVRGDADGAVAIFLGTVRNHNDGRTVIRLEYHAYGEMAEREMELIENEATRRFGVSSVAVVEASIRPGSVRVSAARRSRSAFGKSVQPAVSKTRRS